MNITPGIYLTRSGNTARIGWVGDLAIYGIIMYDGFSVGSQWSLDGKAENGIAENDLLERHEI